MGFLDKLMQEASDVASTVAEKTQEVARSGQLQVQLRNLHGDERDALNEFGREAYSLYEANALAERSGELAGAAAKIADLRAQIAAKEQEIAAVKSDGQVRHGRVRHGRELGRRGVRAAPAAEPAAAEPAADAPPADNGATGLAALRPAGLRRPHGQHRLDADVERGVRLRLEALEQPVDLGPLERLGRKQRVREPVEVLAVVLDQPQRVAVGGVGDAALLGVAQCAWSPRTARSCRPAPAGGASTRPCPTRTPSTARSRSPARGRWRRRS